MPTVELSEGRQASYEVIGRGQPALLLPGGPGFACSYMRGTAELFANVLQSHLVDPHGSGRSTPPRDAADYSPEGHARFYEEVRSALGLPPLIILGHSFGATTALTYAALYPSAVERCIAIAPFGIGTEADESEGGAAASATDAMLNRHAGAPWYEEARAVWESWTERALAASEPGEIDRMMTTVLPLYTAHPERPEVAAALDEFTKDLNSDLAAVKAWEGGLYQGIDLRPLLDTIQAPTLIVAGELDLLCGPVQARPISGAIPKAKLLLIGDCGHIPSIEAPDRFRAEIVAWIEAPQ